MVRRFCGMLRQLRNVHHLFTGVKTPYERRFGEPFEGTVIPFGVRVEYHPISAEDKSRLHQFGQQILLAVYFGCVLIAV